MEEIVRTFAGLEQLEPVARAAFGSGRGLVGVRRLEGGTKKGAYRLEFDDGFLAVAYIWSAGEDFWTGTLGADFDDPARPFSHASGIDLFEAAWRRLDAAGVRVPEVYFVDRGHEVYPADFLVAEYLPGGTLEALIERDPVAAEPVLREFAGMLRAMYGCRGPRPGKVGYVDGGGVSVGGSCEQIVLLKLLDNLRQAARRDARARVARAGLEDVARDLFSRVRAREEVVLVHGELGPDHVMLDAGGAPVLIDIEGVVYFDVEYEHVFLRMRFGDAYRRLAHDGLDPRRLDFYQFAMHVDLVAGPLRIADGDVPDRQWFLDVADNHLGLALGYLS